MYLEVYSIDGRQKFRQLENDSLLEGKLFEGFNLVEKQGKKLQSALKLRKKSIVTVVYLKILNRKRLLELVDLRTVSLN